MYIIISQSWFLINICEIRYHLVRSHQDQTESCSKDCCSMACPHAECVHACTQYYSVYITFSNNNQLLLILYKHLFKSTCMYMYLIYDYVIRVVTRQKLKSSAHHLLTLEFTIGIINPLQDKYVNTLFFHYNQHKRQNQKHSSSTELTVQFRSYCKYKVNLKKVRCCAPFQLQ